MRRRKRPQSAQESTCRRRPWIAPRSKAERRFRTETLGSKAALRAALQTLRARTPTGAVGSGARHESGAARRTPNASRLQMRVGHGRVHCLRPRADGIAGHEKGAEDTYPPPQTLSMD